MIRIADDFSAIAQRIAQLEHERRSKQFSLPDGIMIFLDREISPQTPKPDCDIAMVLHQVYNRMTVLTISERRTIGISHVANVLRSEFPSITVASRNELALSAEDCQRLANWLKARR
jgi:hypothetical protein